MLYNKSDMRNDGIINNKSYYFNNMSDFFQVCFEYLLDFHLRKKGFKKQKYFL